MSLVNVLECFSPDYKEYVYNHITSINLFFLVSWYSYGENVPPQKEPPQKEPPQKEPPQNITPQKEPRTYTA